MDNVIPTKEQGKIFRWTYKGISSRHSNKKRNCTAPCGAEENGLKGVIDVADFNDEDKLGKGKEMVDRLSNLVAIFDGIDLSANRAEGDDLLGDAYEYLMRHF